MKTLIIRNLLEIPIYAMVVATPRIDEDTGQEIMEVKLGFEPLPCAEPELNVRTVATKQEYEFSLPGDPLIEINVGELGHHVNFGAAEDQETLTLVLISLKSAHN